jgi:hypothetical protein
VLPLPVVTTGLNMTRAVLRVDMCEALVVAIGVASKNAS